MKKTGIFFSSFIPFLFAIATEILSSLLVFAISALMLSPILNEGNSYWLNNIEHILSDVNFNACIMCVYSITIIAIFGLLYYRNFGGDFLPNPQKTFHPYIFAGVILLVPGAQFACSYIIAIVSSIFPDWLEKYNTLMDSAGLTTQPTLLLFLYSVLLGPICEELIFRGMTLRSIRRVFPFWAANLFQATLFGLYHMNWLQGIYTALLGLLLGYVCERGGSIYYSILLHILFNFWSTVFTSLLPANANEILLGMIMFFGMFASLIIGSILFHKGRLKLQA